MNAKQRYREFLKSDFWLNLSAEKKVLTPHCERCGDEEFIQAHHKFYRSRWENTQIEDLETLCRKCHRLEHGIKNYFCGRIMLYRDDVRFSRFLHWMGFLTRRMYRIGRGLKASEKRYLQSALKIYPPTPKDSCMKFHVENTLKTSTIAHTFI